ncbi:MAG TPA: carbohydrate ABC transporter permease [Chloroflexota bacterium]|nr:carbohydrate ABC transporter permease [Chloroflexota bacterium]
MSFRARRTVGRLVLTALALFMAIVFIFPIYWIATMSFQDAATAAALPPKFVFTPTLENYVGLFQESSFGIVFANTVDITIGVTLLSLLLGVPAGYALARFRLGSSEQISFAILSVRILPSYVAVIPLFVILESVDLFGSAVGVIVAMSIGSTSFVIWMMRAFFMNIPIDLEEAAMIDGCSRLGAIWNVSLPLAAAGLVATSVLTAITAWNEFVLVLILGGEAAKTLPVLLGGLVTEERAAWGQLAAGGVLTMIPVIVFALLVRRYFLTGMTTGAVNT